MLEDQVDKGIGANLRFLILEVKKQLDKTQRLLEKPSQKLFQKLNTRDDYVDTLRNAILKKCSKKLLEEEHRNKVDLNKFKAIEIVTVNLERIADFCVNIGKQINHIKDFQAFRKADYSGYFTLINESVDKIEEAIFHNNIKISLEICHSEASIDDLYSKHFGFVMESIEEGLDTQSMITSLMIAHYFERMGDSLLNIGESIISACVGERIKIDYFQALNDSLEHVDLESSFDQVEIGGVSETKSGCKINRITSQTSESGRRIAIFKEGREQKLLEEKKGIERWEQFMPGLAPKVYSYNKHGEFGSILIEFLSGHTYKDILLGSISSKMDLVLEALFEVLDTVWSTMKTEDLIEAEFMKQLKSRMKDVYRVHPEYGQRSFNIGNMDLKSFDELIDDAVRIEKMIKPSFSTFIHGDFNVDNIMYDRKEGIKFIDLHRSRVLDYVQDVSVFLVSNFRLQVFTAQVRKRINKTILKFYDFAASFAAAHNDETFQIRLALGLARSFATSTRFVLDQHSADTMFFRSRYLLEKLTSLNENELKNYKVPKEILID